MFFYIYKVLHFYLQSIFHNIINVTVLSGLPPTGSWQDLKDHMREAGDVCYADVYKDGTGVVEFLRFDDMKYAARKLDDSKFRSHEVCFSSKTAVTTFCECSSIDCTKFLGKLKSGEQLEIIIPICI